MAEGDGNMNRRRNGRVIEVPQSPVGHSPLSCATPASNRMSLLITPILEVETENEAFSDSFSRSIQGRFDDDDPFIGSGFRREPAIVPSSESDILADDSYHIEHITNIKEIDPQWDDDEIEEIMFISPKVKTPTVSEMDLHAKAANQITLPGYNVICSLGSGPVAQLILACSHSDRNLSEIKTIRKNALHTSSSLKHVLSEQACLKAVTEHDGPFLPRLLQSFQDEQRLYMKLEYFPCGNLANLLMKEGHFDMEKSRFYASELTEALSFLHSIEIVHRDVRLENVWIASDGHVILGDFSYAKMLPSTDSQTRCTASICGTAEYQAPEIILGWKYDFAIDCWGFGIILSFMHFGRHPFADGNELDALAIMQNKILHAQAPYYPSHAVPFAEWDLIKKCLERNPCLRLNMDRTKRHEYFNGVDWKRVKEKGYSPPMIPSPQTVCEDNNFLNNHTGADLVSELPCLGEQSGFTLRNDLFDGYDFIWQPIQATNTHAEITEESRGYVCTADSELYGPTGDESSSSSNATAMPSAPVRSILKEPSERFAADERPPLDVLLKTFEDAEMKRQDSEQCIENVLKQPRKLRKRRSCIPSTVVDSPAISKHRSVSSLFINVFNTEGKAVNKLRKKNRLSNCRRSSSNNYDLPRGVVQTGRGIGYTHTPPASRSRLSFSSVASGSCFGKLGFSLNSGRKSTDNLQSSHTQVMQQIFGSNWSIAHTNEARMSTVTFGMPDGLGRRVDSMDNGDRRPA